MEFKGILYLEKGKPDSDLLAELPEELQSFYKEMNGLVAYQGGLHIRGCTDKPLWHSLAEAWTGADALHKTYHTLNPQDIPFAQDCVGDQYFLRDESVWFLMAETGEIEDLELDIAEFFEAVISDPVEFLSLEPLLAFQDEGQELEAGQLLHVEPPFFEDSENYSFTSMPISERLEKLRESYHYVQEDE